MAKFDRWINGDRNRRLAVLEETGVVIVTEETLVAEGPHGKPCVYRRDKLALTREEAEWLKWALEQLDLS